MPFPLLQGGLKSITLPPLLKGGGKASALPEGFEIKRTYEDKIMDSIVSLAEENVFGIWFLIGAALVFFMQFGFAMVETGFTRAKNAGNIIMKNLMDFCIGTPVFLLLGFGLMMGEEVLGGFCGMPTLGLFTDYQNFDWSNFVFNLVFCATAATIVSGAMAERTKFNRIY